MLWNITTITPGIRQGIMASSSAGWSVIRLLSLGGRAAALGRYCSLALIAASLGASALAADLEIKTPPTVPYSNWSGPYIGIAASTRFNAVDGNVTSATFGTPPTAISLPPVSNGGNSLEFWAVGGTERYGVYRQHSAPRRRLCRLEYSSFARLCHRGRGGF